MTASDDRHLLPLRVSWWLALGLLVVHFVIWPGLLDRPTTSFTVPDVAAGRIRWIPLVLVTWLIYCRGRIVGLRTLATRR